MERHQQKHKRTQRAIFEAVEPRLLLTTYYVSPAGNDAADGVSIATAFKTISKVNTLDLNAGDQVLFEANQTFAGNLNFDASDSGTAASPVTVGSYGGGAGGAGGAGKATIHGGDTTALLATNISGFVLRDLNFTGNWNAAAGTGPVTGNGVRIVSSLTSGPRLSHLRVDNIDVSGFRSAGLMVICSAGKVGYDDVRVTNTVSHDNGAAGIIVDGYFNASSTSYANTNVTIAWCKAYNNFGIPTVTTNHTGSGIILGDTDGGVIERCLAWNNGALCNSTNGGPVGIWTWDSNNITIQHNESWGNKTGAKSADGGGFDLDGGTTNSVMQYNYSHDNDGAGYLVYQFYGARPFGNNIVRYNISQNDGRAHGYSGIYLGGGSDVKNNQIYNNTIFISPAGPTTAAVKIDGAGSGNVFRNNNLYTTGGVRLVDNSAASATTSVLFQGNNYFASGGAFAIRWGGSTYSSLTAWRTATNQEKSGSTNTGLSVDPQLINPGGGTALADASILHTLTSYQLQRTSPLINAGVAITAAGGRDYHGAATPNGAFDIGAFESLSSHTATTSDDTIRLQRNAGGSTDLLVNSTTPTLTWASGVYPTYTIDGNTGVDHATLSGHSAFALAAANFPRIESITLDAGAYALASPLSLSTLDATPSATLDLSTHSITTTNSAGSWNGSAYTGITGLIAAGRITAAPGVGVAENAGVVTIRAARPGDANLDGVINGDDFFAIDAHAGLAGGAVGYAKGDFDFNGRVDADDYFLIDSNYNKPPLPLAAAYSPNVAHFAQYAQILDSDLDALSLDENGRDDASFPDELTA